MRKGTTMKKGYVTPAIGMIRLYSVRLMAGSLTGTMSTNKEDQITDSEGFGSRCYDFDEEEE